MKELENALKTALTEIGSIHPWFSEADNFWTFRHDAYPTVDYMGDTPEETVLGYQCILKAFLKERLQGRVAGFVDRMTSGRGGLRAGSGRPKGSIKPPTQLVRLPVDIAQWAKGQPEHWEKIRSVMD